MVSQWEDCISFIKDVTGHKYDPEKLNEALEWSYKTAEVEREIYQLRKAVPAPMSSADGFACAYPRLYLMGTQRCYDFFVALRNELKERVEQKIGVIPEEKFRLMWYGLPTWFNMGIFNYFEKIGGVFVWETFYNTGLLPPRRPEDPIKEMAIKCFQNKLGAITGPVSIGDSLSEIIQEAQEYKIDGAVLAYLVTCRYIVYPVVEIAKILREELDIPSVNLESDLVDERIFAESQAFVRLDAFGEQLLKKKTQ
jgi:benzoyl-CoA reductase/2-hydroxyglutaryl-CoA dehydratase subunit BcrC/BadD/HgdB